MDNDIDIYADLPSVNLNIEQNVQGFCNCKELNKKLGSITSEFENLQRIKNNLENNFSSLLKTAKAEIARKDKMIDSLRKRLDDMIFRRNGKNELQSSSTHRMPNQRYNVTKKHENVATTQDIESRSHQVAFCQDENKNKKMPQNDVDRAMSSIVSGDRMHKRIEIAEEKEISLKPDKKREIPREGNKENGSRSSVNNHDKVSVTWNSSAAQTQYTKNTKKRAIEEDSTRENKRLKTENDKNETTNGELYHNCITQDDPKNNLMQYEVKDNFAKSNDRLVAHSSFEKEQVSFDVVHRAMSENTKQSRSSMEKNEWRREERGGDSRRDHDSSHSKRGSVDNSRNHKNVPMSNHVSESLDNEHKNACKYSPPRRYYSKGRSDYENSSSHRLRERSNRTYQKYDDYEYNSRYRKSRLKKDYDSKEYVNNNKSRYGSRERSDSRNRSKRLSNDVEDNGSSERKKYKNRGTKESTPSIADSKKPCDKTTAATDLGTLFSQSTDMDRDVGRKTKNEPDIKLANSSGNTATNVNSLEEGEILDSPEKKYNSAGILEKKRNEIISNSAKIIESKIKSDPASASVDDGTNLENNTISTKQKAADVKTNKAEAAARLTQTNLKDYGKIMQAKSAGTNDDAATDKEHDGNDGDVVRTCRRCRSDKNSTDDTHDATTIQQTHDNNVNSDSCKSCANKRELHSSESSLVAIENTNDSDARGANEIKLKLNKSNTESIESTKKKETYDPDIGGASKSAESNRPNDDYGNRKTESEKLESCPSTKAITKVETVLLNRDTENKEKTDVQNETCNALNKSDVEISRLCLSDHNYVRDCNYDIVESTTDVDAIQKSPVRPDCKTITETMPEETKTKETVDVRSVSAVKAPTLSTASKNKKNQQAKGIAISCRRRPVTLSDSNASMTIMINRDMVETPVVNHVDRTGETSKPSPRLRAASTRGFSKNL